jgi:NADPH:quinone reductase-like Zn-dependent oxidoreductase
MKAIRLDTPGGSLRLSDEPLPTPGPHEVLVQVRAASLNFRDQAIVNGRYPAPIKQNGVPLSDGAGDVVAIGAQVTRVQVGDRVAANCYGTGSTVDTTPNTSRTASGCR